MAKRPEVAVIMGSNSDYATMREAVEILKEFKVPHVVEIVSAHRTPEWMVEFATTARGRGIRAIIAGAGGAAHLPGMTAAFTEIPVIGVPVPHGPRAGEDALWSIVQMPKGVPVATVAIGNSANAALLAIQILGADRSAAGEKRLDQIRRYKESLKEKVRGAKLP
jgi:5-(carboxyamino)imidazole ribonucleotide mutase